MVHQHLKYHLHEYVVVKLSSLSLVIQIIKINLQAHSIIILGLFFFFYRKLLKNSSVFNQVGSDVRQHYSGYFPSDVVLATWDSVGHYNSSTLANTFQTAVTTNGTSSYIIFCYSSLNWTTPESRSSAENSVRYAEEMLHYACYC